MGAVWDVPNAFQKPPHSHAVNKNLTAFSLNKVKMRKAFISAVCTQRVLRSVLSQSCRCCMCSKQHRTNLKLLKEKNFGLTASGSLTEGVL